MRYHSEVPKIVGSVLMIIKDQYPQAEAALQSVEFRETSSRVPSLTVSADEPPIGYHVLSNILFATESFVSTLDKIDSHCDQDGRPFIEIFFDMAQQVMFCAAHRKIVAMPKLCQVGYFEIEKGLSVINGQMNHGVVMNHFNDREVLNNMMTDYLLLRTVLNKWTTVGILLRCHYREHHLADDMLIVSKIEALAGRRALEDAYFNGDLCALERGLQKHGLNTTLLFKLFSCSDAWEQENIEEIMHLLGLTPVNEIVMM